MVREEHLMFDLFGLDWVIVRKAPGGKFELEAKFFGGELPALIGPKFDNLAAAKKAEKALTMLKVALEEGASDYAWWDLQELDYHIDD